MTSKPELPQNEEEIRQRIQGLSPPVPDPAYRERARMMFTGEVPSDVVEEASSRSGFSLSGVWLSGAGIAAAAALILVVLLLSSGPTWRVMESSGDAPLTVNGEIVAPGDLADLELAPGTRLRVGDTGEVTLAIPRTASFILGPGAEVVLDSRRSGLFSYTLIAAVESGNTWGTTGPTFPRGGMEIETGQARIQVIGTTFAVLSASENTCVCVLSGTVDVESKVSGEVHPVPPKQQLYVYSDARPPQSMELSVAQSDRLKEIRSVGVPNR